MDTKRGRILIKGLLSTITILIIVLLFLSEPAEAYTLSFLTSDKNVKSGDKISFSASLKIDNSELFNISYLVLKLNSTSPLVEINCKFYPNGTIIEGCPGIKITLTSLAPYGYGYVSGDGYGYGYQQGTLKYDITIDTKNYTLAKYNTYLDFIVGNKTYEKVGGRINIYKSGGSKLIKNSCYLNVGDSITDKNIRGSDGTLIRNGSVLTNEKLKLSIYSNGVAHGSGYITAKEGRAIFKYSFDVTRVEETSDIAYVYVKGEYKITPRKTIPLSTILVFDKKSSEVSFIADGVNATRMDVIFNGKGC
jgi:hypothetical protein